MSAFVASSLAHEVGLVSGSGEFFQRNEEKHSGIPFLWYDRWKNSWSPTGHVTRLRTLASRVLTSTETNGSVEHSLKTTAIEHAWDALEKATSIRNPAPIATQGLTAELLNE
ncbi:hypothetical protein TNCV_5067531 [Trichonephila clavipes]|nr:hypothetical protein TNCV_5067531 [Trichonephila clavipes]